MLNNNDDYPGSNAVNHTANTFLFLVVKTSFMSFRAHKILSFAASIFILTGEAANRDLFSKLVVHGPNVQLTRQIKAE
jgi:hypothetical protein